MESTLYVFHYLKNSLGQVLFFSHKMIYFLKRFRIQIGLVALYLKDPLLVIIFLLVFSYFLVDE